MAQTASRIVLKLLGPPSSFTQKCRSIRALLRELLTPMPSIPHFAATVAVAAAVLGVSAPMLALNEPAAIASSYELLDPVGWVGKELPILEHIDIREQLEQGTWFIQLYPYDCQDCAKAILVYERMTRDMAGAGDSVQVASVEMPPYGPKPIGAGSTCKWGRLADVNQWFVTTPVVAVLIDGTVTRAWEGIAPGPETIAESLARGPVDVRASRLAQVR